MTAPLFERVLRMGPVNGVDPLPIVVGSYRRALEKQHRADHAYPWNAKPLTECTYAMCSEALKFVVEVERAMAEAPRP